MQISLHSLRETCAYKTGRHGKDSNTKHTDDAGDKSTS